MKDKIKLGDIVREIETDASDIYGKVFKIENDNYWCYWRDTIEEARVATSGGDTFLGYDDIVLAERGEPEIKKIKVYGIVDFMKNS